MWPGAITTWHLRIHGEMYGDVANSYYNLSLYYRNIAEYNQAKACNKKALTEIHGEMHSDVATAITTWLFICFKSEKKFRLIIFFLSIFIYLFVYLLYFWRNRYNEEIN